MQNNKDRSKKEISLYSLKEKFIIFISVLSFIGFSFSYFADISLREVFSSPEEKKLLAPVGKLVSKTGTCLKQRAMDFQFKSMSAGEQLFANDTLMTGDDGVMLIELKNSQTFEVKPSSLVKLSVETEQAMRGLVRLEILQGRSAEQDATEGKSQQLSISNTIPNDKNTIIFSYDEALEKDKPILFKFKVNKRSWNLKIILYWLSDESKTASKTKYHEAQADTSSYNVSTEISIATPGFYEWVVQDDSGHIWHTHRFEALPPQSQTD